MQRTESIYFEEIIAQVGKVVFRKLFTEALFIIINKKKWKQTTHKWGNNHTMEYWMVIQRHAVEVYLLHETDVYEIEITERGQL